MYGSTESGCPLRQGANVLALALSSRPAGFAGGVVVEDVEIIVEYDVFAAAGR